jgi:hypothetical protein
VRDDFTDPCVVVVAFGDTLEPQADRVVRSATALAAKAVGLLGNVQSERGRVAVGAVGEPGRHTLVRRG